MTGKKRQKLVVILTIVLSLLFEIVFFYLFFTDISQIGIINPARPFTVEFGLFITIYLVIIILLLLITGIKFAQKSIKSEDRFNVCGFPAMACLLEVLPPCKGKILHYQLRHEEATKSAVRTCRRSPAGQAASALCRTRGKSCPEWTRELPAEVLADAARAGWSGLSPARRCLHGQRRRPSASGIRVPGRRAAR